VVGSVEIDKGGPNRGRWYWSMWRDAPAVEKRLVQNKGWVSAEAEAEAAVIAAYEELMRLARDAARKRRS
jgi:hypothetical protein